MVVSLPPSFPYKSIMLSLATRICVFFFFKQQKQNTVQFELPTVVQCVTTSTGVCSIYLAYHFNKTSLFQYKLLSTAPRIWVGLCVTSPLHSEIASGLNFYFHLSCREQSCLAVRKVSLEGQPRCERDELCILSICCNQHSACFSFK